jgi:hypothetical protein
MSQYIYLPEVAHFNRRLHCGEGRVSVLLGRESSTESSHHKKKATPNIKHLSNSKDTIIEYYGTGNQFLYRPGQALMVPGG